MRGRRGGACRWSRTEASRTEVSRRVAGELACQPFPEGSSGSGVSGSGEPHARRGALVSCAAVRRGAEPRERRSQVALVLQATCVPNKKNPRKARSYAGERGT